MGGRGNPLSPDASEVIENITEPKLPYLKSGVLEDSNLSQDPDGKIRAATQIIAEAGIDTPPGTITLGDGLDIKASGPQQINESKITGIKYQSPYQEIDKTGSQRTFEVVAQAEVHEMRQNVFDTTLTSPLSIPITAPKNEIINALYMRTNGSIKKFRYSITSVETGNIVDTYPDKFSFERGEGVDVSGSGIHKIDQYYDGISTPTRFLDGQEVIYDIFWENDGGTLLGNSADIPWFELDVQEFEFVCVVNVDDPIGDMNKSTYDPNTIEDDVFDMDNMVESAASKIFSDTERTKLSGIQSGAQVNQTDAQIKTQYENNANTNAFTDAEKSKVSSLESSKFLGEFVSLPALQTAHPSPAVGSYANVDLGVGQDVVRYVWDNDDSIYVLQLGESTVLTDAQIKTQYENNPDTNAFTDAEKSNVATNTTHRSSDGKDHSDVVANNAKVSFPEAPTDGKQYARKNSGWDEIIAGAADMLKSVYDQNDNGVVDNSEKLEGNDSAYHRNRSNHTGTQPASTISDFDTEVANNPDVTANTAKNNYPSADQSKLSGIEAGAEVNQTDAEIKTQYENNANTNAFTDSEKTKVAGLESSKFLGEYISLSALETAHPSPAIGSYANVDQGVGQDVVRYVWDSDDSQYVLQLGESTILTDAQIKTQYENNPDTNAFTDAEKTNLSNQSGENTGDQDISGKADRDGDFLTNASVNDVRLKTNQGLFKFLDGNGDYNIPGATQYAELYADIIGNQKLKNVDEIIVFSTAGLSYFLQTNVAGNYIKVVGNGNYNIIYQGSAVLKKDLAYNFWIQVNGVLREDLGCIEVGVDNKCHPFSFGRILSLLTNDEVTIIGQCESSTDKDWKHQLGTRFMITKFG